MDNMEQDIKELLKTHTVEELLRSATESSKEDELNIFQTWDIYNPPTEAQMQAWREYLRKGLDHE